MKYRCMIETFIDVEGTSEKQAEAEAMKKLQEEYNSGINSFICWEIDEGNLESPSC